MKTAITNTGVDTKRGGIRIIWPILEALHSSVEEKHDTLCKALPSL